MPPKFFFYLTPKIGTVSPTSPKCTSLHESALFEPLSQLQLTQGWRDCAAREEAKGGSCVEGGKLMCDLL